MKRLIFPFIAVIIVLSGCDKNPVVSDDYIDENLFGEWYNISSYNSNYIPDFTVDGFQITRDRKINNLGGNLIPVK